MKKKMHKKNPKFASDSSESAFTDSTDEEDFLAENPKNREKRRSFVNAAQKINQIATRTYNKDEKDFSSDLESEYENDQSNSIIKTKPVYVQRNEQSPTTSPNATFRSESPSSVDDMLTYIDDLISEISHTKTTKNTEEENNLNIKEEEDEEVPTENKQTLSKSSSPTKIKDDKKLKCEICKIITFSNMSNKRRHDLRVHNIVHKTEYKRKKKMQSLRCKTTGEIRPIKTHNNNNDKPLSDNASLSANSKRLALDSLNETTMDNPMLYTRKENQCLSGKENNLSNDNDISNETSNSYDSDDLSSDSVQSNNLKTVDCSTKEGNLPAAMADCSNCGLRDDKKLKLEICKIITFSNMSNKRIHDLIVHNIVNKREYKRKKKKQSLRCKTTGEIRSIKNLNNNDKPLSDNASLSENTKRLALASSNEIANEKMITISDDDEIECSMTSANSNKRPERKESLSQKSIPKSGDDTHETSSQKASTEPKNVSCESLNQRTVPKETDKLRCEICKIITFSNMSNKRRHDLRMHNIVNKREYKRKKRKQSLRFKTTGEIRSINTVNSNDKPLSDKASLSENSKRLDLASLNEAANEKIINIADDNEIECSMTSTNTTKRPERKESFSQKSVTKLGDDTHENSSPESCTVSEESDELRCVSSSANPNENSKQNTSTASFTENQINALSEELRGENSSQKESPKQKTSTKQNNESRSEILGHKNVPCTNANKESNNRSSSLSNSDKFHFTSSHLKTNMELNKTSPNENIKDQKSCSWTRETILNYLFKGTSNKITAPNVNANTENLMNTNKSSCHLSRERGDFSSDCVQTNNLRTVDSSDKEAGDGSNCLINKKLKEDNKLNCEFCEFITFSNMSNKRRHYLRAHNIVYKEGCEQKKMKCALSSNITGEIRSIQEHNRNDGLLTKRTPPVSVKEIANEEVINISDDDEIECSMMTLTNAAKEPDKVPPNNACQNETLHQKPNPSAEDDDVQLVSVTNNVKRVISSKKFVINDKEGGQFTESYQTICEFSRTITVRNNTKTVITASAVKPPSQIINLCEENSNSETTLGNNSLRDGDDLERLHSHTGTGKNINDKNQVIPSNNKFKTLNNNAFKKSPIDMLSEIIVPNVGAYDVILSSTDKSSRDYSCERNVMNFNSINQSVSHSPAAKTAYIVHSKNGLNESAHNKSINRHDKIQSSSLPNSRADKNLNVEIDMYPASKRLKVYNEACHNSANEILRQKINPNSGFLSNNDKRRCSISSEKTVVNANSGLDLSSQINQAGENFLNSRNSPLTHTGNPSENSKQLFVNGKNLLLEDAQSEYSLSSQKCVNQINNELGVFTSSKTLEKENDKGQQNLSDGISCLTSMPNYGFLSDIDKLRLISGDAMNNISEFSSESSQSNSEFSRSKTVFTNSTVNRVMTFPHKSNENSFPHEGDKLETSLTCSRTEKSLNDVISLSETPKIPKKKPIEILSQTIIPNLGDKSISYILYERSKNDVSKSQCKSPNLTNARTVHSIDSILSNTASLSAIENNKNSHSVPDDDKIEYSWTCAKTGQNLNNELKTLHTNASPHLANKHFSQITIPTSGHEANCDRTNMKDVHSPQNYQSEREIQSLSARNVNNDFSNVKCLSSIDGLDANLNENTNQIAANEDSFLPDIDGEFSATKRLKTKHNNYCQNISNNITSHISIPRSGHENNFVSQSNERSEIYYMKNKYENYQSRCEFASSRTVKNYARNLYNDNTLQEDNMLLSNTSHNLSENSNEITTNREMCLPKDNNPEYSLSSLQSYQNFANQSIINSNANNLRADSAIERPAINFLNNKSDISGDINQTKTKKFNQRCEFCKFIKFTDMADIKKHYLSKHNMVYLMDETMS